MRILYIIPAFQHPNVRGPHRHYHFIRELSKDHDVTLLTLVRSEIPPKAMAEMSGYVDRIFTFDASMHEHENGSNGEALPLNWKKLNQLWREYASVRQMRKVFTRLAREEHFDVLIFHGKSVFPVIEGWNGLPIVVDFCDATSMRVRSKMEHASKAKVPLLGLRYTQIRQIERKLVNKTPHIAFISSRDREAILGPRDKSTIIPNGMDLNYWQRRTYNPQPNTLIFTGVMNYGPNEDAALYMIDEILPLVKSAVPDLEVYIVGRDPTPALLECAQTRPEVKITGFVEDMRAYMERAMVYAAPVRIASGMQNKIQEALAMEVPVVTTAVVAEGMKTEDGDEPPLYIAEEPEAFAAAIIKLLQQESERERLAKTGRIFTEKHYDWIRSAKQLEQMCFEALKMEVSL